MSDEMLSQEEIDALLRNTEDSGESEEHDESINKTNPAPPHIDDHFSSIEKDTLGEIGNISLGSSATTLSSLLNQKVEITTPVLRMVSSSQLIEEFPKQHVAIEVQYTEGFKGINLFAIESRDAAIIADLMLEGDGLSPTDELTDNHLSAVQEAMNQMMGTAATSMSTLFAKKVDITPPAISDLTTAENKSSLAREGAFVSVSFQLKIGSLIDSKIMQLLPIPFARELVNQLLKSKNAAEKTESEARENEEWGASYSMAAASSYANAGQKVKSQANEKEEYRRLGGSSHQPGTEVHKAQFSNFGTHEEASKEQRNLDMLLDIPLKVTVELGRTKRSVKEILEFSSGSIIELDKLAGEPVDIHVNDKLIAKGEVVVIDENFGVRITDILSQTARLKKLN